MGGELLAEGIFNAKGNQLRLIYALIVETKMVSILSATTKDLFNKDINHFEQNLKQIIKEIEHIPNEELQVKLFLHMLELLDIKGAHFNIQAEIEYSCAQIIDKAYDVQLKQDKEFKSFVSHRTDDKTQQLIIYQMNKIFESLGAQMNEMDDSQTDAFVEKLEQFIQTLSPEKQHDIQQKLGVEKLTKTTLAQLVTTQGMVIVLTVLVEVAGFAAFTTLTSFIAWFAGIFGATLPFGFYIFATSTLSVITGPFAIAAALVGGAFLINYQNNKVKRMFIPIAVVQLLLITTMEDVKIDDGAKFIAYWKSFYDQQVTFLTELSTLQLVKDHWTNQLAFTNDELAKNNINSIQISQELNDLHRSVIPLIPNIPLQDYSDEALALKSNLEELNKRIERLQQTKAQNKQATGTGFFKSIGNSFSNMQIDSTIRDLHKRIGTNQMDLARLLVNDNVRQLKVQYAQLLGLQLRMTMCRSNRTILTLNKNKYTKELATTEEAMANISKELAELQKQVYGLKHIE